MTTLIEHIEHYIGTIVRGCNTAWDGPPLPFQIAVCSGGLIQDVTAYVTLGFSNFPLTCPVSGKTIRMELLMLSRQVPDSDLVPSHLHQIGMEAMQTGKAYLKGDVIGPRRGLFRAGILEAIYVTQPAYYPESFHGYVEPDGGTIVIAWLVPITRAESEYVRRWGWNKFETMLEQYDPDLLNFTRPSIV